MSLKICLDNLKQMLADRDVSSCQDIIPSAVLPIFYKIVNLDELNREHAQALLDPINIIRFDAWQQRAIEKICETILCPDYGYALHLRLSLFLQYFVEYPLAERHFFGRTASRVHVYGLLCEVSGEDSHVNFGDYISHFVAKILTCNQCGLLYAKDMKPELSGANHHVLALVGSIASQQALASHKSLVHCGTGLAHDSRVINVQRNTVYKSVRGPYTWRTVTQSTKFKQTPACWGDPALSLPRFIPSQKPTGKTTLVLHYVDRVPWSRLSHEAALDINVIINKGPISQFLDFVQDISSSAYVASSSLHGCVIAHAYGIPVLPISMSDGVIGGDHKFREYWCSVAGPSFNMFQIRKDEDVNVLNDKALYWKPDAEHINHITSSYMQLLQRLLSS